jgi:hypothetical protein
VTCTTDGFFHKIGLSNIFQRDCNRETYVLFVVPYRIYFHVFYLQ